MDKFKQSLQAEQIPYREQEPLAAHCTFRIGGPAEVFVCPESEAQLVRAVLLCREQGVRYYLLGNGSNILFSDQGFCGAVIDLSALRGPVVREGRTLRAGAGVRLSALCLEALRAGLTGLEFAYGIPGTVGGAVYMNAGAYGGEISDNILWAELMDETGAILKLEKEHLKLSYRHSVMMEHPLVVLRAGFSFKKGDAAAISDRVTELSRLRREKQPLEYPSAGSTFKRPEGYFAGKLIQDCGLKGFRVGDAVVSEKHSGFVINAGQATAADVMALIRYVQQEVEEKFHVRIEPEVRLLGEF